MNRLIIKVSGEPATKGSSQAFAARSKQGYTGKVGYRPVNKPKLVAWTEAVRSEASRELARVLPAWADDPAAPIVVRVIFWLPRPKNHYGTGRNSGQLLPSAPRYHTGKPDVDKLARAVLDALRAAGVYRDDSQVAQLHCSKHYADAPRLSMSVSSGAEIYVERATEPARMVVDDPRNRVIMNGPAVTEARGPSAHF
jgi:Holliday junction resolvase RusA-like endonuclease